MTELASKLQGVSTGAPKAKRCGVTSKSILLLLPLFWYFGWIQAYPGTYFATSFTVRSRALGSFLSAVVMTFSTWIGGTLVDLRWSRAARGVPSRRMPLSLLSIAQPGSGLRTFRTNTATRSRCWTGRTRNRLVAVLACICLSASAWGC
jgi:hypothetical protein